MYKGRNKADTLDRAIRHFELKECKELQTRYCIFLSHKKEDKPACRQIAEYLSNAEIDYYLDELDDELQRAVAAGDPYMITESLKKGISESTHMLVVVSEKTYTSQWVPFEIGFGHSAIIDKSFIETGTRDVLKLAVLTLKDLAEKDLPDFMQTSYILRGTKSLNNYISQLTTLRHKSINEALLPSHTKLSHPLDNILKWDL